MGKSARSSQRALDTYEQVYAEQLRPHRLALGDVAASGDLAQLAAWHDAALRAASRAADRVGGPGWLARTGLTAAQLAERQWAEHGEPLTGVAASGLS